MAERGFDIEDFLILQGVHLNIPPFLRGKQQLDEDERDKLHSSVFWLSAPR